MKGVVLICLILFYLMWFVILYNEYEDTPITEIRVREWFKYACITCFLFVVMHIGFMLWMLLMWHWKVAL